MIAPFIYSLVYEKTAGLLLIIVTILLTDYFDGFLARRWNATSDLGKILDPLADKICVAAAGITLVILRDFPVSLAAAMIIRDVVILIAGLYLMRNDFPIPVSNNLGRITVAVFGACMIIYSFRIGVLKIPAVILTVIMVVVSLAVYGRIFFGKIQKSEV